MPTGLKRYQLNGDLHHITFSCVRHRPILGTPEARDIFLALLERTRDLYEMNVYAYVVMSTHVHILVSEPARKPLSVAMQILKQRFSKTRTEEYVWEPRYYDFNVMVRGEAGGEDRLHSQKSGARWPGCRATGLEVE